MRRALRFTTPALVTCTLGALAGPLAGDTIHLSDGRVIEGTVQWHADHSAVDIHITSTGIDAILTVPASKIVAIDPGLGPHQQAVAEIERERAALPRDAAPAQYVRLAQQARAIGEDTLARQIAHDLLAVDPTNADAHRLLGEMQVNGVWMTIPEAMAARGYVHYDGRWMTQAEVDRLQADQARARSEEDAARHAADAERRSEDNPTAPTGAGYIGFDGSAYDGSAVMEDSLGGYAYPWWFGGPVVIIGHHHHHVHDRGFAGGGFGAGRGHAGGVQAGGFGAVVGGRR